MEINFGSVDISFVNVVRRIMMRDVHTYAIEKVTIEENTSVMHDEMLADRLSLVPLCVTYRGDVPRSVSLSLSASCDQDTKSVYARDILHTTDGNVSVGIPHPDILLLVLGKGESVRVQAECVRGSGARHYKFTPVTTIDVVKEGNDTKLHVELVGQLSREDILAETKSILNDMVLKSYSVIDEFMS